MINRCNSASYEQFVLDNEMCCYLERFAQGVLVNEDTLAEHVVREIGPEGNYITHEHTRHHCRSGEIWYPGLIDRSSVGAERSSLYDRAHEQVEAILTSHEPGTEPGIRRDLAAYAKR